MFARLGLGGVEEFLDLGTGEDGGESLAVFVGRLEEFASKFFVPSLVDEGCLLLALLLLEDDGRGFDDLERLDECWLLGAGEAAREEAEGVHVVGELGEVLELLGR